MMGCPPILMYHSVGHQRTDPHRICVSPERFEQQMSVLKRRGFVGVPVGDLFGARRRRRGGSKVVGLTFDDGYGDFLKEAVPILESMGFGATVFVVGGMVGGENLWDTVPYEGNFPGEGPSFIPRIPGRGVRTLKLMDGSELREASERGMEVASHGLYHHRLTSLPDDALMCELIHSRRVIERHTGREVAGFCYPYGSVDVRVARAARTAGYRYCCSYKARPERSLHDLPRVYLGEGDGPLRTSIKLWLGGFGSQVIPSSGVADAGELVGEGSGNRRGGMRTRQRVSRGSTDGSKEKEKSR